MNRKDVLDRWVKCIEDKRGTKPVIKIELNRPPILEEEVEDTIRKNEILKSSGPSRDNNDTRRCRSRDDNDN